jgi:hypothetical protein
MVRQQLERAQGECGTLSEWYDSGSSINVVHDFPEEHLAKVEERWPPAYADFPSPPYCPALLSSHPKRAFAERVPCASNAQLVRK